MKVFIFNLQMNYIFNSILKLICNFFPYLSSKLLAVKKKQRFKLAFLQKEKPQSLQHKCFYFYTTPVSVQQMIYIFSIH